MSDQETIRDLETRLACRDEDLQSVDKKYAEARRAIGVLANPPVGEGETFTDMEKCKYVEYQLAAMALTIKAMEETIAANSYTCNDCDERRFGPPAGERGESAEHGLELVCPACLRAMQEINFEQPEGLENG